MEVGGLKPLNSFNQTKSEETVFWSSFDFFLRTSGNGLLHRSASTVDCGIVLFSIEDIYGFI